MEKQLLHCTHSFTGRRQQAEAAAPNRPGTRWKTYETGGYARDGILYVLVCLPARRGPLIQR